MAPDPKTPFSTESGVSIPVILNVGSFTGANGTTAIVRITNVDFSKFKGSAYAEIVWDHVAMSTVGASSIVLTLWDYTNVTSLVRFNNTSSVATDTDGSTLIGSWGSFTKPGGTAKVGLLINNSDTTSRTLSLYIGRLWFIS